MEPRTPIARTQIQPPSFGCRLLVLVALVAFIFGGAGALIGNQSTQPKSHSGVATPRAASDQQQQLVGEEGAIVNAANKASAAVVSITSTSESRTFLGPIQEKAGGTGFIITADGLIVTNKHVVEGASGKLSVVTKEGQTYEGTVKALDPLIDFAIIKIEAKNLPVVDLGNSDSLQVGQEVIAIGNALGEYQNTVTTGVISAKERTIQAATDSGQAAEQLADLLQTDAAINPGNSGGPLVNLRGQVVGMNTAVAGDAQGIGFAIPINQVKQSIDSYTQKGKIVRASLGVRFTTVTKDLASLQKLPVDHGALVTGGTSGAAVTPGSAADKGGLKDGDIITAVNGTDVDGNHSLPELVGKYAPGTQIELTINRGGKETKVKVSLDARESETKG